MTMKKLALAAAATLLALAAHAQTWPSKPVTLLVPFPPGGSSDAVARALGPKLQERFGQTFLVTSLGPQVIAPHKITAD